MADETGGREPMTRSDSIDNLRASITVLVVAVHAAMGYVTFGFFNPDHFIEGSTAPIVDDRQWAGFDLFVVFNNTFFMALMFFIAGLFVAPSIGRKGAGAFLRDRVWRLGLPFLVGVLFLSPLAYYPSFLMTGARQGYFGYWRDMILFGPWSPGPLWFIGMLLAFQLVAAPAIRFVGWACPGGETPGRWLVGPRRSPILFFLVVLCLSIASYLPMVGLFGPFGWVFWGPMTLQVSRVVLYLAWFGLGVFFGARGLSATFLGDSAVFGKWWWAWAGMAAISFVWLLGANHAMLQHFSIREAWSRPPGWISAGLACPAACTAICMALLAMFQRFPIPGSQWLDSLRASAYGIYLVHYPLVVWAQYSLLDWPLGAVAKAAIVFAVSLGGSWGLVAMVRRIGAVGRII